MLTVASACHPHCTLVQSNGRNGHPSFWWPFHGECRSRQERRPCMPFAVPLQGHQWSYHRAVPPNCYESTEIRVYFAGWCTCCLLAHPNPKGKWQSKLHHLKGGGVKVSNANVHDISWRISRQMDVLSATHTLSDGKGVGRQQVIGSCDGQVNMMAWKGILGWRRHFVLLYWEGERNMVMQESQHGTYVTDVPLGSTNCYSIILPLSIITKCGSKGCNKPNGNLGVALPYTVWYSQHMIHNR